MFLAEDGRLRIVLPGSSDAVCDGHNTRAGCFVSVILNTIAFIQLVEQNHA